MKNHLIIPKFKLKVIFFPLLRIWSLFSLSFWFLVSFCHTESICMYIFGAYEIQVTRNLNLSSMNRDFNYLLQDKIIHSFVFHFSLYIYHSQKLRLQSSLSIMHLQFFVQDIHIQDVHHVDLSIWTESICNRKQILILM